MKTSIKTIRRITIGIMGTTVVIIGFALLVLPGPGIIVILIGLALLATEFEFAKVWLEKAKQKYSDGKDKITKRQKK